MTPCQPMRCTWSSLLQSPDVFYRFSFNFVEINFLLYDSKHILTMNRHYDSLFFYMGNRPCVDLRYWGKSVGPSTLFFAALAQLFLFSSQITSRVPQGTISKYPNIKFSLNGTTNECARTDTLLLPLTEVSTGAVSLFGFN